MITIGITGPIGSGKSTVCKEWEKSGVPVFYADEEAKNLMVSNKTVKSKLIEIFGSETYFEDGSLNKQHLIREAFEKKRTADLNGIVHPAVFEAFLEFCNSMRQKGEKIVVKEAALLLNNGRPDGLDKVVLVLAGLENRLSRVMNRDGVSRKKVEERNAQQPDFDKLQPLADYVIENDGTLQALKVKSAKLLKEIRSVL